MLRLLFIVVHRNLSKGVLGWHQYTLPRTFVRRLALCGDLPVEPSGGRAVDVSDP